MQVVQSKEARKTPREMVHRDGELLYVEGLYRDASSTCNFCSCLLVCGTGVLQQQLPVA